MYFIFIRRILAEDSGWHLFSHMIWTKNVHQKIFLKMRRKRISILFGIIEHSCYTILIYITDDVLLVISWFTVIFIFHSELRYYHGCLATKRFDLLTQLEPYWYIHFDWNRFKLTWKGNLCVNKNNEDKSSKKKKLVRWC